MEMKDKFTIKVYDFTKEIAVESAIGEEINKKVSKCLKEYNTVILDFINVKIVLTAFIKATIKSVIDELGQKCFSERIKIINLPTYSNDILEKIFNVSVKKSY